MLAPALFLAFLLPQDTVLRGGLVHDGTGGAPRVADVTIRADRILAVGEAKVAEGARVIDCKGLVVAPGFIDLHNHSDRTVTRKRNRPCTNYLTQGCTTLVTGNCGGGRVDVVKFLGEVAAGVGCNIAHLVPHGSVRSLVMGRDDRAPREDELARMRDVVARGMRAGAFGMSTGLYYVPGAYAKTDEIIELAKVVAKHGGLYASHMRHEDERILDSVRETIAIGRGAGVRAHVSHVKARGRNAWGKAAGVIELIEEARADGLTVTADQYPYLASSSSLAAYLFPPWARAGGNRQLLARIDSEADGPKIRAAIRDRLETYPDIRLSTVREPSRLGKSLATIAEEEGRAVVDLVIEIQRAGGARVVNFAMSEDDVRLLMCRPWVATASDGLVTTRGPGKPHPRSFGTFPRKLGHYAAREKVVPLAQAVRSSSGLPADILGIRDRGYLRAGARADVVVFDERRVIDKATFAKPYEHSEGVVHVFVNGQPAVRDGEPTGGLHGRALRGPGAK